MKHLLAIVVVCTCCFLGCGGNDGANNTPDTDEAAPGAAVEAFAKAMEAGDAATLKSLCPDFEKNLTDNEIADLAAQFASNAKANGGIASITIDNESINNNTATVTATLTNGSGTSSTETFKLNKVDGQWLIDLSDKFSRLESTQTPETSE